MTSILHRVGMHQIPRPAVFKTLATLEGLSKWWTPHLSGNYEVGGLFTAGFPVAGPKFTVAELEEPERVVWRCVAGPQEWIGTWVTFELRQDETETILLFKHEGWREPTERVHHYSTQWAYFLLGLKTYLERGAARALRPALRADQQLVTMRVAVDVFLRALRAL